MDLHHLRPVLGAESQARRSDLRRRDANLVPKWAMRIVAGESGTRGGTGSEHEDWW